MASTTASRCQFCSLFLVPKPKRQKLSTIQPKLKLLSLPDDPLTQIFHHLGASKTSGTFNAPRHAFALALTNTRLLDLFRSMLTKLTPGRYEIEPPTLSAKHVFAVARLAGPALRELSIPHLPKAYLPLLNQLPAYCPHLEVLDLLRGSNVPVGGFHNALLLPLRNITIVDPLPDMISDLTVHRKKEVSLGGIEEVCFEELKKFLRDPPNKLYLFFDKVDTCSSSKLNEMMLCIKQTCSKIEELTVEASGHSEGSTRDFVETAKSLIADVRNNDNSNSLCKSITLNGTRTHGILANVHPNARIEITGSGLTLVDEGDGAYIHDLHLDEYFLTYDMSRVESISFSKSCKPEWKKLLSGIKLQHASVNDLCVASDLCLDVDRVLITYEALAERKWNPLTNLDWLSKVRKLGFITPPVGNFQAHLGSFLEMLINVFDVFRGDEVLVEHYGDDRWNDDDHEEYEWDSEVEDPFALMRRAQTLLSIVHRFEERGGEAWTVKMLAEEVILEGFLPFDYYPPSLTV